MCVTRKEQSSGDLRIALEKHGLSKVINADWITHRSVALQLSSPGVCFVHLDHLLELSNQNENSSLETEFNYKSEILHTSLVKHGLRYSDLVTSGKHV